MIGLENRETAFFTIESPNISLENSNFSKDLLSLSIEERMSTMPTGNLTFYDPSHNYSRILRSGAELRITWGYRSLEKVPDSVIAKNLNIDEISGNLIRKGYRGFVSSPTGKGGADGIINYSCKFTAFGLRGTEEGKKYEEGDKASVINQAFDDIGVSKTKRLIDFSLGKDRVTTDRFIRQDKTTFAFLCEKAREWQAIFHLAFSPSGEPVGIFIDANKIASTQLPAWVLAAGGASNAIGYKGELNNVKNYEWSLSDGESGAGDNVRADIIDGQIVFRRYVAETEKVITYRMDEKKIQAVFKDAALDGMGAQINLTKELLSKNDFNVLLREHYFYPVETTTAPNGYGYKINCEMIGNPLYMPGNRIVVKNGFPDCLGGSQSIWYINSVNHKIDRSGYNMDVEIIDVFGLSPIGMPLF